MNIFKWFKSKPKKEAETFEDQLKKQARFIGCWISTDMYKN